MTDHRAELADQYRSGRYRGRFAPTPSGPLHLGSLLTALASWLQARSKNGVWLLRIDDLDRPRCIKGMDSEILHQLESHGLDWDETPRYQTQHVEAYEHALARLLDMGRVYPCTCTRATLDRSALDGPDGPVYSGHCRLLGLPCAERHALRYRVDDSILEFQDGWAGPQQRRMQREVGDFTLRRSDGMIGYQLACAIDEKDQCITEVVRGADLLGSSFRQIALMQALGLTPPQYRHGPVLKDPQGNKLSKQNHAEPILAAAAADNLLRCLHHLKQQPPAGIAGASPRVILEWALQHWQPEALLHLGT